MSHRSRIIELEWSFTVSQFLRAIRHLELSIILAAAGPLTVTLKIDNLTDAGYLSAVGFRAPGRSILGGAELEF